MGLEYISVVMQRGRLRWFGHGMGNGNLVKSMNVEGVSAKGSPKKTGNEVIQNDPRNMGLNREAVTDRAAWRAATA